MPIALVSASIAVLLLVLYFLLLHVSGSFAILIAGVGFLLLAAIRLLQLRRGR